ncbi:hypothetical protein OPV22_022581 [Ensete ventricosum]|uniref:DUF2845 domain-containing protein n=1 Tax=Ensete ventricosum TaxID=4639 RepID=A0AAV8QUP2_ENSVE|nr:hypothetical protein OPV22_022581 [Ensete ventricosum]
MNTAMKRLCLLALLAVAGIAGMERADGARECGRVLVDRVAFEVVTPCGAATRDAKVVVPGGAARRCRDSAITHCREEGRGGERELGDPKEWNSNCKLV